VSRGEARSAPTLLFMQKPLITSLSNSLIKRARSLNQKKARIESGLFLVEGIHHVGEAIEAGWEVELIIYAPELLTSNFARDLLSRHSSEAQPVSVQVMESLAGKENPQGILAIVHQKETQLSEIDSLKNSVALVAPQDPGNVGTILRTLDAVGADALFLLDSKEKTGGSVDLYHPTLIRASMGTIFWKPVIRSSFDDFTVWTRKGGVQVIGTSARGDVDYQTLLPKSPWIVVLGNEQKGLSPEQLNACDVTVSMPMKGRVSSLNLAVAAGILLYQFMEKK
jgi:TrmH family RNA methyltransferase